MNRGGVEDKEWLQCSLRGFENRCRSPAIVFYASLCVCTCRGAVETKQPINLDVRDVRDVRGLG